MRDGQDGGYGLELEGGKRRQDQSWGVGQSDLEKDETGNWSETDKELRSQAIRTSGVQKMVWKCLVFPGVLLALTFDLPTIAFRSEDLPTFGWLHQEIKLVSSLLACFVREPTHPMRPTVR